ncbi:uncharacterized protein METZ01_LOCUS134754, partial [marine metagenome]
VKIPVGLKREGPPTQKSEALYHLGFYSCTCACLLPRCVS